MNIGVLSCLVLAAIFGIMSLLFTVLGEKGAVLISGFNTIPKAQREQYDKARMSKDQRNMMLLWTVVMLVGAALSYLVSSYLAAAAFVVWLILFFKEVHLDEEKAFGKYKRKEAKNKEWSSKE